MRTLSAIATTGAIAPLPRKRPPRRAAFCETKCRTALRGGCAVDRGDHFPIGTGGAFDLVREHNPAAQVLGALGDGRGVVVGAEDDEATAGRDLAATANGRGRGPCFAFEMSRIAHLGFGERFGGISRGCR